MRLFKNFESGETQSEVGWGGQVHCSINLKTVRSIFLPTNLYFLPPQGAFYIWTPAFSTTLSQYVLTRLPGSLPIYLQRRFKSKVMRNYILIIQTSWDIFEQIDCHPIATLLDEIAIFPQINTCFRLPQVHQQMARWPLVKSR